MNKYIRKISDILARPLIGLIRHPFVVRFLLLVVAPVAISILGIFTWFSGSLPITSGKVLSAAIRDVVLLTYDENGVPYIKAKYDDDAYFALGYVHAQNRLWQMDMNRRFVAGTLSAVLGKESLPSDIFMRTIGAKESASKSLAGIQGKERIVLNSYVAGVNKGIADLSRLPPEYYIKGVKPEPWTALDTLLVMKGMQLQLSFNFQEELLRSALISEYGLSKTNHIMAHVSELVLHDADLDYAQLLEKVPSILKDQYKSLGSNGWAVSGRHTKSKAPLLVNDPHLANTIPSTFYMASIKGGGLNVKGATIPGLPFVVIGRNKFVAWGATASKVDTQDLFIEKINPVNDLQYMYDGSYRNVDVVKHSVEIKKDFLVDRQQSYDFVVRRTENGPIISDLLGAGRKDASYSFRWSAYSDDGGTFKSYLNIGYSRDWNSFNDALVGYVSPVMVFIYADVQGNIGRVAPGAIPIRVKGSGSVPVPGWSSQWGWSGWVPREDWPKVFNPKSGIIVAANNNISPESYSYHLTNDWAESIRHDRIYQLLSDSLGRMKNSDMKSIQMDVQAPYYLSFKEKLLSISDKHIKINGLKKAVSGWDGQLSVGSKGGAFYSVVIGNFYNEMLIDDYGVLDRKGNGAAALGVILKQNTMRLVANALHNPDNPWCDDLYTKIIESCDDIFLRAVNISQVELIKRLSSNIEDWAWGDLHKSHYPHYPLSKKKHRSMLQSAGESFWSPAFHRSRASSGGVETLNVAPYSLEELNKYQQYVGPVYRQIADMSKSVSLGYALPTGQSGNIFSRHYDDMMDDFGDGHIYTFGVPQFQSGVTFMPAIGD
ncbi:penicillin acylase family protein [Gilvimarinus sp. SDUM040013]|uniref:Penicillin acylase family protein n=1 Tax=Gilvimarinus gilvus TaxID=3058038 RepID=A0ABU4S2R6_9GAMM|nr:penicillin acylase family protein [Gilvimarinus sp. SDUM040013]MDO3384325.1 penicillin acylase family protein [Gilvimarinus sp. SDUM040013]MDX6851428.1 penicillin acylase family protein [Gilvimarinus sp. SDUM040013]